MLRDLQAAFRAAILAGEDAAALKAIAAGGISVERRLSVHRNNVFASLVGVLEAAYPSVRSLLGASVFGWIGRSYIAWQPPKLPQLSSYGAGFPAFLEGHEIAVTDPYVPDVAQLEWARIEAYFAADAPPLRADELTAVPLAQLPRLRLALHPSARLISARFPVDRICANPNAARLKASGDLALRPTRLLVLRPHMEVLTHPIGAAEFSLLSALAGGATLERAAIAAAEAQPSPDLQQLLLRNLTRGTFEHFSLDLKEENPP